MCTSCAWRCARASPSRPILTTRGRRWPRPPTSCWPSRRSRLCIIALSLTLSSSSCKQSTSLSFVFLCCCVPSSERLIYYYMCKSTKNTFTVRA
uniref:Uncharacterized protein n=1 Tax=Anopheles gambiae TaxID=7165 RepID=O61719_ANOGA|nr:unknown [Anopheles gambiae]